MKRLFVLLFATVYFSSMMHAQDISQLSVDKVTGFFSESVEVSKVTNPENPCNSNHYKPYFWWTLAGTVAAFSVATFVLNIGSACITAALAKGNT